jgi:hypothetical protein
MTNKLFELSLESLEKSINDLENKKTIEIERLKIEKKTFFDSVKKRYGFIELGSDLYQEILGEYMDIVKTDLTDMNLALNVLKNAFSVIKGIK